MTPDASALVRANYNAAVKEPRALAKQFYTELFSRAPNLRPLFPADLTSLQGHFEAALALVVRNLDEMPVLKESLRDLGAQHVHWGARPEDYVTARDSLVAAFRTVSPAWSDELERAWRDAITGIIVPMLEGAAVHTAVFAVQLSAED